MHIAEAKMKHRFNKKSTLLRRALKQMKHYFEQSKRKISHKQENARRRRQIEKGMLTVHNELIQEG